VESLITAAPDLACPVFDLAARTRPSWPLRGAAGSPFWRGINGDHSASAAKHRVPVRRSPRLVRHSSGGRGWTATHLLRKPRQDLAPHALTLCGVRTVASSLFSPAPAVLHQGSVCRDILARSSCCLLACTSSVWSRPGQYAGSQLPRSGGRPCCALARLHFSSPGCNAWQGEGRCA